VIRGERESVSRQGSKARTRTEAPKNAPNISPKGWKRSAPKAGRDQPQRLEEISPKGWKRSAPKAGRDQRQSTDKQHQGQRGQDLQNLTSLDGSRPHKDKPPDLLQLRQRQRGQSKIRHKTSDPRTAKQAKQNKIRTKRI